MAEHVFVVTTAEVSGLSPQPPWDAVGWAKRFVALLREMGIVEQRPTPVS